MGDLSSSAHAFANAFTLSQLQHTRAYCADTSEQIEAVTCQQIPGEGPLLCCNNRVLSAAEMSARPAS